MSFSFSLTSGSQNTGFSFGSSSGGSSGGGGFNFGSGSGGSTGFSFGSTSSSTGGGGGGFNFNSGSSGGGGSSGFSFSGTSSGSGGGGFNFNSSSSGGGGFNFSGTGSSGGGGGGFNFSSGSSGGGGGGFNFNSGTGSSGGGGFNFGSTMSGNTGLNFGSSLNFNSGSSGGGGFNFGSSTSGGMNFGNMSNNSDPSLNKVKAYEEIHDPRSVSCTRKAIFYNVIPDVKSQDEYSRYITRPSDFPEDKWNIAQKENPKPGQYYPVLITKFEGLKIRHDSQREATKSQKESIKKIQDYTAYIKRNELGNLQRIQNLKLYFTLLSQRLLKIMIKLELLKSSNYNIPEEDDLFNKLFSLQKDLLPLQNRLNEVMYYIRMHQEISYNNENVPILTENNLMVIEEVLSEHDKVIKFLTEKLKEIQKNLGIVLQDPQFLNLSKIENR